MVHLKLIRAEEHLQAFKSEVAQYLESQPYELKEDRDSDPGALLVTLRARNFPHGRWSVIIGDFVHNLRSALDHLAAQLVKAAGNDPIHDRRPKTQFPILTRRPNTPGGSPGVAVIAGGVSPAAASLVDFLQPYQLRNPTQHPLALLAELSNRDKHQRMNVVMSFVPFVETRLPGLEGLITPPTVHPQPVLLEKTVRIPYGGRFTRESSLHIDYSPIVLMESQWNASDDESSDATAFLTFLFAYVCQQVIEPFRSSSFPTESPVHLANPLPRRPRRRVGSADPEGT